MTYSVYYIYDKSHRLTQQYTDASAPTLEAHYYTFNQRNCVTQIQDVGGSNDALRSFVYNALGERVVATDVSTALPAYWSYDGRKFFQDKQLTSTTPNVANYRHNCTAQDAELGSVVEYGLPTAELPTSGYPAMSAAGTLQNIQDPSFSNESFEADWFGRTILSIGGVGAVTRLRAFTGAGRLEATTTQEVHLLPDGGMVIPERHLECGGPRCGPGESEHPHDALDRLVDENAGLGPHDGSGIGRLLGRGAGIGVGAGARIGAGGCGRQQRQRQQGPGQQGQGQQGQGQQGQGQQGPTTQGQDSPPPGGPGTVSRPPSPNYDIKVKLVARIIDDQVGVDVQVRAKEKTGHPCPDINWIQAVRTNIPRRGTEGATIEPGSSTPCGNWYIDPCPHGTATSPYYLDPEKERPGLVIPGGVGFTDAPRRDLKPGTYWKATVCLVCPCEGKKEFTLLGCWHYGWSVRADGGVDFDSSFAPADDYDTSVAPVLGSDWAGWSRVDSC